MPWLSPNTPVKSDMPGRWNAIAAAAADDAVAFLASRAASVTKPFVVRRHLPREADARREVVPVGL